MKNNIFDYIYYRDISVLSFKDKIKLIIQLCLGFILDLLALPIILGICLWARYFHPNKKNKIFIGCFPNNNLVYVAKALRAKMYYVLLVPFFIPKHEKSVVNYDIDLQAWYPKLYLNWFGNRIINYGLFIWALCTFDIFIMPFLNRLLDRTPLLQWLEFQLLRLAKKIIILNPYGADIYTPKLTLKTRTDINVLRDYQEDPYYSTINENYIKKVRNYGEKYAHKIIAALDLVDYLTRIDILLQMRCIDTEKIKPIYNQTNEIFKVLHAPNHRHLKGTAYLIEAVDRLKNEGFNLELEIVEKRPNTYLLDRISLADCVADQFLVGAYGRLAIESMAYGKPVLCYLREDLKKLYPHWENAPILDTSINTIYENLRYLIEMPSEKRITIGKLSREYVEKFHSCAFIGTELHNIINTFNR